MVSHYLTSAYRKLQRSPFATLVNVLALALGFTCFVGAIGAARYWTMSDRHFEAADRINLVTQSFEEGSNATGFRPTIAQPVAKYLKEDFPALEAVARISRKNEWTVFAGDRKVGLSGARADADILRIFDFRFLSGDPRTALDSPDKVILTRSAAERLFGNKPALGETIQFVEDYTPTVSGVIDDFREPSHFAGGSDGFGHFDFLYGWPTDSGENEWWLGINSVAYVLFPENGKGLSPTELERQLPAFIERRLPADQAAMTKTELGLVPLSGLQSRLIDLELFEGRSDYLSVTLLLSLLGLLVLLVSCINYANLATAQAAWRAKEVGMRKVLGAGRLEILFQYWFEALLLTAIAALLSMGLLRLAAPILEVHTSIDLRLGLFDDIWPLLLVAGLVFVVALAASAYPALFLSRVAPMEALRQGSTGSGSRLAVKILVAIQFAGASALLIVLLVINGQNSFIKEKAMGDTKGTIVLLTDIGSRQLGYEELAADLASDPNVELVSQTDFIPWSDYENYLAITRAPDGSGTPTQTLMHRVGYGFFELFSAKLLAGRAFDRERNDVGSAAVFTQENPETAVVAQAVVDRPMIEELGFATPDTAVGEIVTFGADFRRSIGTNATIEIIGVIEPMPLIFSAGGSRGHLYLRAEDGDGYPVARIRKGHTKAGLGALSRAAESRDADILVSTLFYENAFEKGFRTFGAINRSFVALSLVALAISIMGLFAMAVFVAARRRHEIGIRKTLGASTFEITTLLLRDFSVPVIVGNLAAWPIAYLAARTYLDSFMQRIDLSLWPWIASMLLTLGIAWFAVGGQAIRAARVQPAEVLKDE